MIYSNKALLFCVSPNKPWWILASLTWFSSSKNTFPLLWSTFPNIYISKGQLRLFILSGASPLISSSILGTYRPGEFIFQCPIFLPSYCSWGSQGKNTEVVCHSLLQWTTFCQSSSLLHLGNLPWLTPINSHYPLPSFILALFDMGAVDELESPF